MGLTDRNDLTAAGRQAGANMTGVTGQASRARANGKEAAVSQQTAVSGLDDMRVISLKDSAQIAGVSLATLRRRIDAGDGPAIVRMSPRRIGVRAGELRKWLGGR